MANFREYAKFYDIIYKDKLYKKEANMVYKWANKPKKILELGGGTGRHAKYWVKKAQVINIEKSWDMGYHNNICQTNFGDIKEYNYSQMNKVDAIFAMFNVVGYADLIYYMDKLPLKKGGYFIFDCWDGGVIEEAPPEYNCRTFGDIDRIVVPVINYPPFVKLQITIVKNHKPLFTEDHIIRSYYISDIKNLCKAFGYKLVATKNDEGWAMWVKLKKL